MHLSEFPFTKKNIKNIFSNIRNDVFHFLNNVVESRKIPILIGIIIYLLSIIFASPTRHGADRFYVLALDIIEHHSVNIQKLVEDGNHYAIVSVDVFQFNDVRYIGVHPGQALWGLPGLYVYHFIRHINNFSHVISTNQNINDKLDFILGTFAMNSTSSAAFTAIAALFFIYLANMTFVLARRKMFKISIFMLLFYLATPLFYYSTHIIENETESCLIFISLGLLCLNAIIENKFKIQYYLIIGLIIGLAFLTNFSSLILLPFGILHVVLNGFVSLDYSKFKSVIQSIQGEMNKDLKKKVPNILWLCIGWSLPTFLLFYYQYLLFSNPFTSPYIFLLGIHTKLSPTLIDYTNAFIKVLLQYLFSPHVGLLSYTPLLFFPVIIFILRFKSKKDEWVEPESTNQILKRSLFRTMVMVLPLYIFFYTVFAAMHLAKNGELISNYNVYSARHLLPIVLPLGYILFDSIININKFSPTTKLFLWCILAILWMFSLATNISATLIGDWIFSLNQIWVYIYYLFKNWHWDLTIQGRSLVDW